MELSAVSVSPSAAAYRAREKRREAQDDARRPRPFPPRLPPPPASQFGFTSNFMAHVFGQIVGGATVPSAETALSAYRRAAAPGPTRTGVRRDWLL